MDDLSVTGEFEQHEVIDESHQKEAQQTPSENQTDVIWERSFPSTIPANATEYPGWRKTVEAYKKIHPTWVQYEDMEM